ncbi:nitrite reductase (NO-forming) / hydroxylamine reductase [Burkholderiales bacterium]|nr:nitrite reductase (NO-forming) / hydroxylamine reductase [Burkholderiales bacterium]
MRPVRAAARPVSDPASDPVSDTGSDNATCGTGASGLARWRCAIGWAVYLAIAALVVVFAGAAVSQVPPAHAPSPAAAVDAAGLYATHCASCHGADRFGLMGPALLPESLERLRKPAAAETIAKGRAATQMQAFSPALSKAEIDALVAYVYAPPATKPVWGEAEIRASRVVHRTGETLPDKPSFSADPLNLFVLVEAGDQHASILDGDRFERLARFPTRYALHGGPKFTPDGRFVYFASRDGWISKYDLWNLAMVAEVRAGLNTRNAAVSGDGKYVMVGNYLPHSIVVLDADLNFVKLLPVVDREGKKTSRVSAVYDASPRKSFVAALKDIPEVWEISYDPKAPEIPIGVIHDFRYREGAFVPGFLNVRRSVLQDTLDDFFFTQDYSEVMGASREAGKGQVVHLDVRRKIADLDLPGMPHLGSGITFDHDGRRVMATPNLKEGVVSVIDVKTWKPVKQIRTNGPGFFMRSHDATPYAWVDAMMSPRRDTLQVIDKRSLEIVGEVTPSPGRTAAHIEFDRYGRHALASVWENDGAVVVYDAATLKEVKRIPASKPVGKYNVWNKIIREAGTSH